MEYLFTRIQSVDGIYHRVDYEYDGEDLYLYALVEVEEECDKYSSSLFPEKTTKKLIDKIEKINILPMIDELISICDEQMNIGSSRLSWYKPIKEFRRRIYREESISRIINE